ncbi:oxidoreductase [Lithospermum erythrorhizon]|uniref:Oxidoreductase n=1 Tax=Lithospermum erythrorhizon TaxID=34254 RepID=A0AAV3Q7H6_LITER
MSIPDQEYNREDELKAFDDSKAGVKGLLDAGIKNVPKIFIRPPEELVEELNTIMSDLQVPVIDLGATETENQRKKIVDQLGQASEEWGFFQVVNHGIPVSVLDEMISSIRLFHEQDVEMKKELYSRDRLRKVRYESNLDLYRSTSANWRDTLNISMVISDIEAQELPQVCRDGVFEYINHVSKLGEHLFEFLSEALGLAPDYLGSRMECGRGRHIVCHYYPPCPEPELTIGSTKHTDPAFITILLQDHIGGLQVLHQNQWIDVQPIPAALIVNIGDFLQILSNDKFRSVKHRVIANDIGPRISAACFFMGGVVPPKIYGPIKELGYERNPSRYKDFVVTDYVAKFHSVPLELSGVHLFKL